MHYPSRLRNAIVRSDKPQEDEDDELEHSEEILSTLPRDEEVKVDPFGGSFINQEPNAPADDNLAGSNFALTKVRYQLFMIHIETNISSKEDYKYVVWP